VKILSLKSAGSTRDERLRSRINGFSVTNSQ